ncbi:TRAP transporter large permease [Marinobacter sp. 1-3A]|uniref:TRAP transporter large permease n=1 Tax=Marinobacter sp. 1-3A TaxID=2582920 RepID=UPI0019062CB8|nr:TRAP transporter large permease [Marinobacter sp. 1-3A]MBK1875127.1 TRAP transporter large permease [Marinobacter sp. 1-3A]
MTDIQLGFFVLASIVVLISIRVPIAVSLISASFAGLWYLMGFDIAWGSIGVIPYQFASTWVLGSIPMFLLMGFLCYHAELTQGMFRAAGIWLSGIPGGLAISAVFGSAGFAAVSGSSVACSAAMGRIAVPEMIRHKYDPELATGTVAVAGTIGALIPPSIIMILYGVVAQQSITGLFLGGIAVGVITAVGYTVVILVRVKLNPSLAPTVDTKHTIKEKFGSLKETWPVLLIMAGIFGGLFGGVFTPTEAGAVGAFLSFVVGLLKRSLTFKKLQVALVETLVTTSALIIIAIGASLLTRFLALSGTGEFISDLIIGADYSAAIVIIGIVLVYLFLGMFLEPIGAMLLTLPIIIPVVGDLGLSLLWFGVVLTKLLEIGMITPPIGMNVFVIKSVVGNLVSTKEVFRGIFWFLIMDLLIIFLIIYFPNIILFIPSVFD